MHVLNAEAGQVSRESINQQGLRIGAAWFRLIVLGFCYITLLLVQILQGDFLQIEIWQSLNLLLFTSFLLHLPIIEAINSSKNADPFIFTAIGFDLITIGVMMVKIGEPHAVFVFLYLLWIAFSGFVYGIRAGLTSAMFGALVLNIAYTLGSGFNTTSLKGIFFIQNISGFLVGYLGGRLGDEIQFITEDVALKKDVIRSLTDLNELIVDNIPSAILTVDMDGKILRANRGAAKLLSDLSLVDKPLGDVSDPVYQVFLDFKAEEKNKSAVRTEITFLNYRQEKQIYEVIYTVLDPKSDNRKYVLMLQNLTEVRNLENAMKQKEKLAAVGQLAAGIAHEIRNPLASISGSVQLLSASLQTQTPEDKKLFAIIIKEIDRLNNLISEFLDYVRPSVVVDDPIDLNTLLNETLDMVANNDRLNRKVEQRRTLQTKQLIRGQAEKLKQALLNILINAYQAMENTLRPELIVRTFDNEGNVVLIITDNGTGISKENINRIFEPFHTTKPKGTGLGLAITHKILETHNAIVNVESELGKGTTFEIIFPATKSPGADDMYAKKYA